jgi:hypothetical protein
VCENWLHSQFLLDYWFWNSGLVQSVAQQARDFFVVEFLYE